MVKAIWFKIWQKVSDLPANQQVPALVLSLEDEALDAVLEIDESDISKENGVDFMIKRLNRLFKKDSTVTKYQISESFMTFKRASNVSVQAYLNEFDKRLLKQSLMVL